VYSLTCLLYECLTGRPPFETGDLRQLMTAHMFSPPPRPSIMRRGINRAFDDVVARGMAKKPEDRFATAGELAKAATAAVEGIVTAPPEASPPPTVPILSPSPRPETPRLDTPRPDTSRPATKQFSAVYQNPAGTGYTPYPPPVIGPPEPPRRKPRFGGTQVALVVATILLFAVAVVLAIQLMSGNRDSAAPTQTMTPAPPPSVSTTTETVQPSTTTPSATSTTTTTPTSTTSGAPLPGVSGTDAQGFVGHAARCDDGSTVAAAIRTSQSLAVICQTTAGSYYYHGERLRDGANVRLNNAVPNGGGFDVTNPSDGASYEVRPDHLTIRSNGHVDSNEPALEYSSGSG
jgi:serine/threonine-protein kinase